GTSGVQSTLGKDPTFQMESPHSRRVPHGFAVRTRLRPRCLLQPLRSEIGTQCEWRSGVSPRQLCREQETCPRTGATWFRGLYVTRCRSQLWPLHCDATFSSPGSLTSEIVSALRWGHLMKRRKFIALQRHGRRVARGRAVVGGTLARQSGVGLSHPDMNDHRRQGTETRKRQGAKSGGSTHNVRNRVLGSAAVPHHPIRTTRGSWVLRLARSEALLHWPTRCAHRRTCRICRSRSRQQNVQVHVGTAAAGGIS